MEGSRLVRFIPLLILALIIVGCSSEEESLVAPIPASVEIEMTSEPTVSFNPTTGKTTAIEATPPRARLAEVKTFRRVIDSPSK